MDCSSLQLDVELTIMLFQTIYINCVKLNGQNLKSSNLYQVGNILGLEALRLLSNTPFHTHFHFVKLNFKNVIFGKLIFFSHLKI